MSRCPFFRFLPALGPLLCAAMLLGGCSVQVNAFRDYDTPLAEHVLSGRAREKILVLPVRGFIDLEPDQGLAARRPSVVQDVAAMLRKAGDDPDVRALLIQVDSPGGTVVASDILYAEIMRLRAARALPAVTLMMTVAASGGYQAALAGDRIVAHASTVTGSIGTVFLRPDVSGLMGKIGVGAEVTRSGRHKDIGSPLRGSTPEERAIVQAMIDDMNGRFLALVAQRRGLDREALDDVADARVFTAAQAQALGLVDTVGSAHDALAQARALAGLAEDARVVVYRRRAMRDDTLHNPPLAAADAAPGLDLGLSHLLGVPRAGFYALWAPEYGAAPR